jgi:tripartite-type tricarboxylate transporter receptor subunit TctC
VENFTEADLMMATSRITVAVASIAALTASAAAQAPSLAGKSVQMIIGSGSGGGYDLWGRVVARHIGKHLPGNPTVVPQNMPGGGSITAANYIYNVAPKDGTAMGIIASAAVLGPITGAPGARFDPTKMTWLGSPTKETRICIAFNSPRVKVKTVNDLYQNELIVGSAGAGVGSYAYPKALNVLLGLKFKVIGGFQSIPNVFLAMERGEVDGVCTSIAGVSESRPDWIMSKKVAIIFQAGSAPDPELKDVPLVNDLARTPEDRQAIEFLYAGNGIARPFIAPPDMSADRIKMLQDAFMATMKDADFLADAKKQTLDVAPEDGEHLAALVKKIYATPKPIVDKIGELIK